MLKTRDYIYYDFIVKKKYPKKIKWKLYCWFRKLITIRESPSKIHIYLWEDYVEGVKSGLNENIK